MSVEYVCFRELAEKSLRCENPTESDFRNAVSRSYYYIYHSANGMTGGKVGKFDSNGKPFSGGMHKRLSSFLTDNAAAQLGFEEKKTRKLGVLLKQMHALRVTADYHLTHTVTRETAEMVLYRSLEIDTAIKELIETRR